MKSLLQFILSLLTPGGIFLMLAILGVVAFFIMRYRHKRRLKEMADEDAWMESLDENEWS
jgi:hypothetical protein